MKNLNVLLAVILIGLGTVACKEATPENNNTVVKEEVKEVVKAPEDTTKKAEGEKEKGDTGITTAKEVAK